MCLDCLTSNIHSFFTFSRGSHKRHAVFKIETVRVDQKRGLSLVINGTLESLVLQTDWRKTCNRWQTAWISWATEARVRDHFLSSTILSLVRLYSTQPFPHVLFDFSVLLMWQRWAWDSLMFKSVISGYSEPNKYLNAQDALKTLLMDNKI